MITNNVFQRVFHVFYKGGTGTCFLLDHAGQQYFVTAKHVIDSLQTDEKISIFSEGSWIEYNVQSVKHHPLADISIFSPPNSFIRFEMRPGTTGIIWGQNVYFLGFPFGLQTADGRITSLTHGYPLPFVKGAILSAINNDENDCEVLYLDGNNNSGFSGGPVVFRNPYDHTSDLIVAGVISGYRFSEEPAYLQGTKTELVYKANTGIIIVYSIKYALELIEDVI